MIWEVAFSSLQFHKTQRRTEAPDSGLVVTKIHWVLGFWPEAGERLRVTRCPLALIRYLGVWVTPEFTMRVGKKIGAEKECGRKPDAVYDSGKVRLGTWIFSCAKDPPAARRHRATQQMVLQPMAGGAELGRHLLAQSSDSLRAGVLGLLPLIGGEAVTSLL